MDKLEITSFVADPPSPTQAVAFKLRIRCRNLTGTNQAHVPVQVLAEGGQLIANRAVDLPGGGQIVEVVIQTTCNLLGPVVYWAQLDPQNTFGESASGLPNNERELRLQVQAGATETREFDFEEGIRAGAEISSRFIKGDRVIPTPRHIIGGMYTHYPVSGLFTVDSPPAPLLVLCLLDNTGPLTLPLRHDLPIYLIAVYNFNLKHGWVVDNVEDRNANTNEEIGGGFRWLPGGITPSPGAHSIRLAAEVSIRKQGGQITHFTKIRIRGLRGLDPYR